LNAICKGKDEEEVGIHGEVGILEVELPAREREQMGIAPLSHSDVT